MDDLMIKLAEILEVETVKDDDVLNDFDCWDSLTLLSIISLASESYGKQLTNDVIRASKTIGGLKKLIEDKR